MQRVIIISNRLPVTVQKDGGALTYVKSVGGLSTGLSSVHKQSGGVWIGWPGISEEELTSQEKAEIIRVLAEEYQCVPVFLSKHEIDQYYHGFCNKTIWPLFHYFVTKVDYNTEYWITYQMINHRFLEIAEQVLDEGDLIWIHDYQLMLLPQMIKDTHPSNEVGFFLHIPFPSFEIFRLLLWRESILHGILGADLIGFHTYDYVNHFSNSVRRLLGLDAKLNRIAYEDRYIHLDAFPMGIDYERFTKKYSYTDPELDFVAQENSDVVQTILSVDRLDYSKGIPQRIEAFQRFLSGHPEYYKKIRWNLIVAPSRVEVDSYGELLKEITEAISAVNGKFGTLDWMPIWYYYRSFSQESLIYLYRCSDVMLVTPLRDGMNLVAKEYIASRTDYKGMLVISETAGAASELAEAVIVNPNDLDAIGEGIKAALEMPTEEKILRNKLMHQRLKRYSVEFWANDFIKALHSPLIESDSSNTRISIEKDSEPLESAYREAVNRILLLDYDGTLVGYQAIPEEAKPDQELKSLLRELCKDSKNSIVIISGRDKDTLEKWLGDIDGLYLVASHGLWLYLPRDDNWIMTAMTDDTWKEVVRPILERYSDGMPGSLIEEKDFSLALHYRLCEANMAEMKIREVKETLMAMTGPSNISLQEGNKVLEVKDTRVSKGHATSLLISRAEYDFFLGVGDDLTDEDLFSAIPETGFSIKIGLGNSIASYSLKSWKSMRYVLKSFVNISREQ
jgi:trehalose 6-phosphate synthase/phosphatase